MVRKWKIVSLAMFVLALAAPGAWPTTVMKLSEAELALMADAIFVGRCIGVKEEWDDAKGKIYTYATFDVEDLIKGDMPGQVTVKSLGGQVGNLKMIVPGSPKFSTNQEYLVFLWKDASGAYRVLGMTQGKYNVYTEQATGRKFVKRGAVAFDGDKDAMQGERGQNLDDFIAKITSILRDEERGLLKK